MTANKQNKARLTRIFKQLAKENPEPTTELDYQSPFECLVAVILSAQATDKSVNLATPALFQLAKTPENMAQLTTPQIEMCIQSIGLFRTKAKNLLAMSQQLCDKHQAQVPDDRQALEALPGVGRKTANVILNTIFGHPTLAVDTHIFRLAHRLGFSQGKTPLAVEQDLLAIIPKPYLQHAHHWLILHGRYICQARRPKCAQCPLSSDCPSVFSSESL